MREIDLQPQKPKNELNREYVEKKKKIREIYSKLKKSSRISLEAQKRILHVEDKERFYETYDEGFDF